MVGGTCDEDDDQWPNEGKVYRFCVQSISYHTTPYLIKRDIQRAYLTKPNVDGLTELRPSTCPIRTLLDVLGKI